MSIYDKAGVVQIPSGYKAGTTDNLYSVLPANGNGDFNATRGSSATRVNKDGLIESVATNVPRLDYPLIDGVVQDCPALLLEPSRTNSLLQSNQFDTTWTTSNATVTSGQTGVGGSTDAWLLNSSAGYLIQFVSLSGASTMSVYAKKGTAQGIRIRIDATTDANCYIDLSNGSELFSHSGTNLDVTNVGNDWYRISLSIDSTISNVRFYAIDNTATSTSGTIYIQYAQLEAGSYPTSYIPTSGSTATRSADVCNGSGTSAEFNDSEGVLFAEISALADDGTNRRISISDGSTSDRVVLGYTASSNQLIVLVSSNSVSGVASVVNIDNSLQFNKIALKYKLNDFALWINGIEVLTDNSLNSPIGLNDLSFEGADNLNDFYGKIKQLSTFKTALSDSELATLTS